MDEVDPLSDRDRELLSAWAEHEPSEGFADAVLEAWQLEQAQSPRAETPPSAVARSRRTWVGIAAGLLAASVVLLLARTLPSVARSAPLESELAQCDHEPEPSPLAGLLDDMLATAPAPEPNALADDALAVLARHCMPCHDGDREGAKAGALRVYDVREPGWWDTMSDEQLREAQTRIEQLGSASAAERRSMATFVGAELQRRATAASPS